MIETNSGGTFFSVSNPGQSEASQVNPTRPLLVAATFSMQPIEQPLRFWIARLNLPLDVQLAPHGQVLQQLLDPNSAFARNVAGVNVLLLRAEDVARDVPAAMGRMEKLSHLESAAQEWARALSSFRKRSAAPLIVVTPEASLYLREVTASDLTRIREQFLAALQEISDVTVVRHSDIETLYPVEISLDDESNQIAHLPFTTDYFVAIASMIIRKAVRLVTPLHKVIVLDCDNTLWSGACGEISPQELQVSARHFAFQRMLVAQNEMGVILCLCSKNNAADVEAVFASRPDMPLKMAHIASCRINWETKSANLGSLASELKLGLDSFIFIDDNPVECAEVAAAHPQVDVLRIPSDRQDLETFLTHTWAFDISSATREAKSRSDYYRQNRLRAAASTEAPDFASFLAALKLRVRVEPLQPEHLERAAELVVRTNQFNLTTSRRLPGEIFALIREGWLHALIVHVSDRFGDYGLTGLAFLRINGPTAEIDTLLLSCRVLGRGVEANLVNQIGRWASDRKLDHIQFEYRRTERNAPAREFLRQAFSQFEIAGSGGTLYNVPVEYALGLEAGPTTEAEAAVRDEESSTSQVPIARRGFNVAAQSLTRISDIVAEMRRQSKGHSSNGTNRSDQQAPAGSLEESLAHLWQELLHAGPVDRRSGFIELGGDSVLMVRLAASIAKTLGVRPSLAALMRCHSLSAMAQLLSALRPVAEPTQNAEVEEGSL